MVNQTLFLGKRWSRRLVGRVIEIMRIPKELLDGDLFATEDLLIMNRKVAPRSGNAKPKIYFGIEAINFWV